MKMNTNTIRKMIIVHIFLTLIFLFFWSVYGLPWGITFVFDLLLLIETFWVIMTKNTQAVLRRTKFTHLIPFFAVFTLYLIVNQLLNFVGPVDALMAYRRTFRFYLFFLVCAVLLTEREVEKIMNGLIKLQALNLALTLYQFFVMRLTQDNLGGIFGIEKGANAYTNVFLCIISTYMIVNYLEKRIRMMPMALTVGSALLIAAIAEIKVFFIELVIIVLMGILLSKPSARTVKTVVFSGIGFAAAIALLGAIFPEHLAILMSAALLTQYTTETVHGYNISRMNAFGDINRIFFKDNIFSNLFGYGFGNCESGTAFHDQYSRYNYTWFTHQITFLETGYVGILLYVLFFGLIYLYASKSKKVCAEKSRYFTMVQIISALCVIWMIYDQSLRAESAYLIFFVLAIPLVIRKNYLPANG